MLAGSDTLATLANHWLARFESALGNCDRRLLESLFQAASHWRDVLALTWRIETVSGAEKVTSGLLSQAERLHPAGFRTDPERTAPRYVTRAGTKCLEAIFRFETAVGEANGVLRLIEGGGEPKAWTLLTALQDLKGHEEHVGRRRPQGQAYSRDFAGPNWLDLRRAAARYDDRDPAVLVVGGGQAGLSIAARLVQRDVDTLIVDRWARVGDNWRKRYHALTLHNQVHVNHLPYMQFPPNWPVYIPKDKLANWFESYAEAMELNYWTGTEFEGGSYDESNRRWTVSVQRDGKKRVLHPRHVVMATGVSGIPTLPPSPSAAKRRFASASSLALSVRENPWKRLVPPQLPSDAMRVASPMRTSACITLSGGTLCPGVGGSGLSL